MKTKHTIMIAAAVFVLAFIAVMWVEGRRLSQPSKNQPQGTAPFSEFKAPPDVHFTPLTPH